MTFLNQEITYYSDDFRSQIDDSVIGFLNQLKGVTVFDLVGIDNQRTRVVTTLIHGNEPSGLIACHLWLKSNEKPATNLRIIICNPEAAQSKPLFTHRYINNSEDLNRKFGSHFDSANNVDLRAQQIISVVNAVAPEAILDLHNTSGNSPAFGVAVIENPQVTSLVALFANKLILTELKVGAIMEVDFKAPIVTIECGGAQDSRSHQIATDGLHQYFNRRILFEPATTETLLQGTQFQTISEEKRTNHPSQWERQHKPEITEAMLEKEPFNQAALGQPVVRVHSHPVRVQLNQNVSVGFDQYKLATTHITLRDDLEKYNKDVTPVGEFIGWCGSELSSQLQAFDHRGINQIDSLFYVQRNCLYTKVPMQLFMVTKIVEIATKDCLFYVTIES